MTLVALLLPVWFGVGLLTTPLVYMRFRARHAVVYRLLEEYGESGHSYALVMALMSIAMGGLAVPFTLIATPGTGWRVRA